MLNIGLRMNQCIVYVFFLKKGPLNLGVSNSLQLYINQLLIFDKHLIKPNDLPLARLSVQRKVTVLHLALMDKTRFHLSTSNRPTQMVIVMLDGKVGQGNFPAIPGSHSRASYTIS